jgi:3-hydroxyacyl-CoA dehydrogenase/enoyl-CoA hydratase/3-hydroxybutyryl-CoA epimerase
MNEAMKCVDEGIAPEAIDAALVAFGMPMGPIELADTVGLDVAVHAGKQLVGDAVAAEEAGRTVRGRQARQEVRPGLLHLGRWQGAESRRWRHGESGLAERMLKPLLDATQRLVRKAWSPTPNWPTPA